MRDRREFNQREMSNHKIDWKNIIERAKLLKSSQKKQQTYMSHMQGIKPVVDAEVKNSALNNNSAGQNSSIENSSKLNKSPQSNRGKKSGANQSRGGGNKNSKAAVAEAE